MIGALITKGIGFAAKYVIMAGLEPAMAPVAPYSPRILSVRYEPRILTVEREK
jgi:hypothetical protein